MHPQKIMNHNGFTLIEIMLAMTVIAIGLLGMAALQFSIMRNNKSSGLSTIAYMLAQSKLEELKSESLSSSALTVNTYTDTNNPLDENGASGGLFNRSWAITAFSTDARNITVSVQWTTPNSGSRTISVSSVTRGDGF